MQQSGSGSTNLQLIFINRIPYINLKTDLLTATKLSVNAMLLLKPPYDSVNAPYGVTHTYFHTEHSSLECLVHFQWETCGKQRNVGGFTGGAEVVHKILPLPQARLFVAGEAEDKNIVLFL